MAGSELALRWACLAPGEVWPRPEFGPPAEIAQIRAAGLIPWGVRYGSGIDSGPIGFMAPSIFKALLAAGLMSLADAVSHGAFLMHADRLPALEALLADRLGRQGWRNEQFVLRDRSAGILLDGAAQPHPLALERSLFRPLGLLSSSVHLTVMTPQGKHWVGKRAAHKRIDPGLWDAAAAGGLPANELAATAVRREAAEEAGLSGHYARDIRFIGRLRVCRLLPDCLHHEQVWVFALRLPAESVQPTPQDGEVEIFDCVWPEEILRRYRQGQFNYEAACGSLLQCLDEAKPGRTTTR